MPWLIGIRIIIGIVLFTTAAMTVVCAVDEGVTLAVADDSSYCTTTSIIFEADVPYKDDEEKAICQELVESLSDDEREEAARTSHAYLEASVNVSDEGKHNHSLLSKEVQERMAQRMVRRHLVANKGNKEDALTSIRATLEWKKSYGVEVIRRCFWKSSIEMGVVGDEEEKSEMENMRELLEETMQNDAVEQVRGYDKGNRVLLVRSAGTKPFPTDFDAFLKTQLYWLERAIACTERKSQGREEKINICVDYNGFERANKPPISHVKGLFETLQAHYPERLHVSFACDTPLFLRVLWKVVSLFLHENTTDRIKIVTGEDEKMEMIGPIIAVDQAMPYLLPGGGQTEAFDLKRFLYEIPFDHAFND